MRLTDILFENLNLPTNEWVTEIIRMDRWVLHGSDLSRYLSDGELE